MNPEHVDKIGNSGYIQQTPLPVEHMPHHYTWSEHLIWWCVHQFGALTILACIGGGILFWAVILFRRIIKEKFGDIIAWADERINGKKGG